MRIHKKLWTPPNANTFNQIDHVFIIFITKRWSSSILYVQSYRGANCDSDHYIVKSVYRCRISKSCEIKTNPLRQFGVGELKNYLIAEEYRAKLQELFGPMLRNHTGKPIDTEYGLKRAIKITAEEVAGMPAREK